MTNTFFGFTPVPTHVNGSTNGNLASSIHNAKRKSRSFSFNEDSNREVQSRRVQSPPFERRSTCPYPQPDLVHDSANTVSDAESSNAMDMDMDQDMGGGGSGVGDQMMNGYEQNGGGNGVSDGYSFGNSGSGGFGFGPGAEEDEEDLVAEAEYKNAQYSQMGVYPSLTPHPNPNHFTNQHNHGFNRSSSPLNAQAFSATLKSPSTSSGLYQPSFAQPLAANATEIEKARSQHGPQCKSIPRLQLSPYPDPQTGKQSMWTWCPDCQSVEKTQ